MDLGGYSSAILERCLPIRCLRPVLVRVRRDHSSAALRYARHQVKRYAPNAHTICEIIDARWGANVQKVFIFFCFLTNVIVSSMLVLGGAATVNAASRA